MKRNGRKSLAGALARAKNESGFTLVELIVVIAILGILAGVGTVGYSGYIKKANLAADQTQLSALNTAFAVACIENGVDHTTKVTNAVETWNDGSVTGISSLAGVDSAVATKIIASFGDVFEGAEFKTTDDLGFANGAFTLPEDGLTSNMFSQIFAGLNLDDSVDALNASTFGTIGAQDLMTKVDTVTSLAAGLAEVNEGFVASLAGTLGSMQTSLGMGEEEFTNYFMDMIEEKATQLNPENPDAAYDQARYAILSNYAVLNAAQNTVGKSEETILSSLKGGVSVQDIKNMIDKNADAATQQEGMANAAMMYAMYTAYANSLPTGTEKDAALSITGDIGTFVTTMANQESAQYTGFQSYLDTDEAKTDINGYLGAMDIINKSVDGNQDAVSSLLMNGYDNAELIAALQNLMG